MDLRPSFTRATKKLAVRSDRFRHGRLTSALWLLMALTGCGSSASTPVFAVNGKVLLANGKPLAAGRVTFVSTDGQLPEVSGEIQPDGSFSLTSRSPGDGAAPGEYKVRVEPAGRKDPRRRKPVFPVKYVDEDSSGLVVTVRAEANQVEPFTLK
jgi:hypothetical protein